MYDELARQAKDEEKRAFYQVMTREEDKRDDFIDCTFDYFPNHGLCLDGDGGR